MTRAGTLIGLILAAVTVPPTLAGPQQPAPNPAVGPPGGAISEYFISLARQAKANGMTALALPPRGGPRIYVPSLDMALDSYPLVLVQPSARQTVVDDDNIYTWYKAKRVSTVSGARTTQGPQAPPLDGLPEMLRPQQLLPLREQELLIVVSGGAI